jgi:hypothetical protein
MSQPIKTCIDRYLPEEDILKASELAIQENPANEAQGQEGLSDQELALVTGKKWENGKILKVAFLDGDPDVQAKIQPLAHLWSEYANITFDFGNHAEPHIRISFAQVGSWSHLGTDALLIPDDQATMNYGWLRPDSADEEYDRVVVHEFGHALACIHEHQNPATDIPWDEEKVYAYYTGPPNNWPKSQVFQNLLQKYNGTITQFSAFDKASIMLYPIPNEHTIGDYEVGWNRVLSELDKSMIAKMYPRTR